jgi:hypothetical protein
MRVAFAHPGNYDCRLGIYVGSVMPPDGANTEFGIVQRLIKLGSLTGCDACQEKACFFGRCASEGGRVLPGGAPLPYRSIGVLKKNFYRNFGNSGIMEIERQRQLQLWTSSKGHRPRSTVVISNRRMAEFAIAAAPNLIQFERRPAMLRSSGSLSLLDLRILCKLRAALLSDKVTARAAWPAARYVAFTAMAAAAAVSSAGSSEVA